MKILILGSTNSRNSGGIYNSARMMGLSLKKECGADVGFLMHSDEHSDEDRKGYSDLPLYEYRIKGPKLLGYSPDLYRILHGIKPDIIHTQGIWMYFSRANRRYNLNTKTPYVISPHGMLDYWQLHQSVKKDLKKKIVLKLYESAHLKNANCIHALCHAEYEAVRDFGLNNPVAIIPNGVDLPDLATNHENVDKAKRWKNHKERKTLLFLSRIHQKKGIDVLLEAWALSNPSSHNWQLVIAGESKDKTYMDSLTKKVSKLKIHDTVEFIGGQFGLHKKRCFMDADAFILPSYSEGLPMAVLEAWSYKLPVLMTKYCNLPEGFSSNAAISIDTDSHSISVGIKNLQSLSEDKMEQLGNNGYALVKEKFSWESVAQKNMEMYNWILGKVPMPKFIHCCKEPAN